MNYELFQHETGFGYRIPSASIEQQYKRGVSGLVAMTEEEAAAEAQAHIAELTTTTTTE